MPKPQKEHLSVLPSLKPVVTKVFGRGVTFLIDSDSDNTVIYTWEPHDKILTVFPQNFNDAEQADLIVIIKEYYRRNGLILSVEQEKVIDEYVDYNDRNPNKDTIEVLTGNIPANDLDALKMSFFMRDEKIAGEQIGLYKQEIRERFGPRGAYIANLCTAGYFEKSFVPFLHKVSAEKFRDYYDLRVGKEAAAIFVHNGMSMSLLRALIKEKIDLCQKNDVPVLRVHGLGIKNVDLINDFFRDFVGDDLEPDVTYQITYKSPTPNISIEYDIKIP